MAGNVTYTKNIEKMLTKIDVDLDKLPKESLDEFKELTPKRSGNARRNTRLNNNTINADYAYAQKLDEGYSDQAPKGMVAPFNDWMADKVRKIFRK